jgi:23S rRNA pseudouridine1911/1915/1917 synthase
MAGQPDLESKIISTVPDESAPPSLGDGEPEGEVVNLAFGVSDHGVRLDKCLAGHLPGFSRSYIQQCLAQGDVLINGRTASKASMAVKAGDACRIDLKPTDQARSFVAEDLPLDVVYEDAHLLVVNKPAGLVVHPAAGNWSGTLLNGLLHHHAGASLLPRAGIVHRLDKDTSGLMVVAKTRPVMDALVAQIAAREVTRLYLAITGRRWEGIRERQVDQPMGRDPGNRLRMAVLSPGPGSKPARTQFVRLDTCDSAALVACKLFTGRTHQIRVHLASIGQPILGDGLYGGRSSPHIQRQALHATRLMLKHPATGVPLDWEAPLPADMVGCLDGHGLHYNRGLLSPDLFGSFPGTP